MPRKNDGEAAKRAKEMAPSMLADAGFRVVCSIGENTCYKHRDGRTLILDSSGDDAKITRLDGGKR